MKRFTSLAACALLFTVGCGEDADTSTTQDPALEQVITAPDATAPRGLSSPITGQYNGTPFSGIVTVTRFVVENGTAYAVAQLSGVTGVPADAVQALQSQILRIPLGVAPQGGGTDGGTSDAGTTRADGGTPSCSVLDLLLQPLHLDLLGAVVDLDEVDLDITAVPGAGNLLGNLLCSVAGLLDSGGLLSGLTGGLADQLLGTLNGLTGGLAGGLTGGLTGGAAPGAPTPGAPVLPLPGLLDGGLPVLTP